MDEIEIKFRCEHCQQEYLQDNFKISVFFYGIFYLIGKDYGYAGITCPSCLKTITQKGNKDLIESIRKHASSPNHEPKPMRGFIMAKESIALKAEFIQWKKESHRVHQRLEKRL